MSTAQQRRKTIRTLLEEEQVPSQHQLLELLVAQGIAVTQPQLSRDLRALGVVKKDGRYVQSERVTGIAALAMLLRDARPAGANLVVLICEPGSAGAVARALEAEEGVEGIVGTVAGDDTVFVAVENKKAGAAVSDLVQTLIETCRVL